MANIKKFDLIVIGSGAGEDVAVEAAGHGLKTAVIEKGALGGTCLNRGCIPSKMLIHSADVVEVIKSADLFGIKVKGYEIDFSSIIKRVSNAVDGDSKSIENALTSGNNPVLYHKEGEFAGKKTIKVGNEIITADKILIAAGARPSIPNVPGLKESGYITSEEALRLKKQPKVMTIIGGGYIAAELAHFYGTLGTKINIIHRNEVLINREDNDIALRLTEVFKQKYNVYTGCEPTKVSKSGTVFEVEIKDKRGKMQVLKSDALLVATGVTPYSDTLKLEKTGVKTNERGYIIVDAYLRTNVDGIFALGDIIGKYLFRHSANHEARYAIENMVHSKQIPVDYRAMPHAIFTSPQIGSVGKTEEQLKEEKIEYLVGKYDYINTAMGSAIEDRTGFVKILVEKRTGKIAGCHIIGHEASTLIHEVIVAMKSGNGMIDNITSAIHIHPALNEVISRATYSIE
jgi:dihydrolipoamide dehydrogenase